jgi:uncharacterized protein (DUF2336 family)
MARDRSAERRNQLGLTLVDLFRDGNNILTERERAMMTDILRRLLSELEVAVRRAIAERLASDPHAPRSLVQRLAHDEIEVAWPVLRESHVLEDVDLIEVIQHRTLEHRLAIAQRGVVSEAVADALVQSNEGSVIVALLGNQNARLSQAAMEYLVEQSERCDAFQDPLLHRSELTVDLARRMFVWVSASLRDHIVKRFELDATMVDDLLESVITKSLADSPSPGKDVTLINEMERAGLVGPSLMLRALMDGDITLYVRIVENLTGIRAQLAKRLLFEEAGEGLAVLCRAVDLPKVEFLEIYSIGRRARLADAKRIKQDCQRIGEFYESLTLDTARTVVLRWRRESSYLSALRELELAQARRT